MPSPRRRLLAYVLASVSALLFGTLNGSVDVSAAAIPPHLYYGGGPVPRSLATGLGGDGLEPSTTYKLTADYGTFVDVVSGEPTSQVTTHADGRFHVLFYMPADLPASVLAAEVTATPPDEVAVSVSVAVGAPFVLSERGRLCATQAASLVIGGVPPGSFQLSSPYLTLPTTPVTAEESRLAFSATSSDDLPATVTVTATSTADSTVSYDVPFVRSRPYSSDDHSVPTLWRARRVTDCLTPGELVHFTSSDPRTLAPPTAMADATGRVHYTVQTINTAAPRSAPGVLGTAATSGQSFDSGPRVVEGTTLASGARLELSVASTILLAAAHDTYYAEVGGCDLFVFAEDAQSGDNTPVWQARHIYETRDDCYATVTGDGDLVLVRNRGGRLWSSTTQGTGYGNRLVMQDDGNLVLRTAADRAVWSSRTGVIRTPRAMGAGQLLTVDDELSNGDTRLFVRPDGNLVVTTRGAVVWSSHTAGRGGRTLKLLRGGRLALINTHGRTVWTAGRVCGPYAHLLVRANGDVQVRSSTNALVWHTATAS